MMKTLDQIEARTPIPDAFHVLLDRMCEKITSRSSAHGLKRPEQIDYEAATVAEWVRPGIPAQWNQSDLPSRRQNFTSSSRDAVLALNSQRRHALIANVCRP
jgi:hypothetical protein